MKCSHEVFAGMTIDGESWLFICCNKRHVLGMRSTRKVGDQILNKKVDYSFFIYFRDRGVDRLRVRQFMNFLGEPAELSKELDFVAERLLVQSD